VLKELGVKDKDIVLVYNKGDLLEDKTIPINDQHESVIISAKTGYNFEKLTEIIVEKLFADRRIVEMLIPFDKGQIVSYLCEKYEVLNLEYLPDGTKIKVELSESDLNRYESYTIVEDK
jgi:GTP-binding protein HflX